MTEPHSQTDSHSPLPNHKPDTVYFCRARFKEEVSQAIYDLMATREISRSQLAEMVGKHKSFISRILSGGHNFELNTISDLLLALGRFPHLVLGTDSQEMRLAVDEGASVLKRSGQEIVRASKPKETEHGEAYKGVSQNQGYTQWANGAIWGPDRFTDASRHAERPPKRLL